jgi:hypothetical protein
MVPAFMARHPPPPPSSTISSMTPYYSYHGPALAPAKTIKPASETSKDFFRNMRDLQNSMADFSTLHDTTVSLVSPLTNFSDETLSSAFFLLFTVLTASLFISAHLVPWRIVFLLGGNGIVASGHPKVQALVENLAQRATDKGGNQKDTDGNFTLFGLSLPSSPSAVVSLLTSASDISLDSSPEEREVEIFELQHRTLSPYSYSSEWEPFLFTPTPYDPLSPSRIAGDRPRGSRFFEDVRPPSGWAWKGKKWELDLDCREWVVERMVTGVEFEVHGVSGDGLGEQVGGWVWDLLPPDSSQASTDDGDHDGSVAAYGDLWEPDGKRNRKAKEKDSKGVARTWEEGTGSGHGTGEWRRRRWIRVVKRVSVSPDKGADASKS